MGVPVKGFPMFVLDIHRILDLVKNVSLIRWCYDIYKQLHVRFVMDLNYHDLAKSGQYK